MEMLLFVARELWLNILVFSRLLKTWLRLKRTLLIDEAHTIFNHSSVLFPHEDLFHESTNCYLCILCVFPIFNKIELDMSPSKISWIFDNHEIQDFLSINKFVYSALNTTRGPHVKLKINLWDPRGVFRNTHFFFVYHYIFSDRSRTKKSVLWKLDLTTCFLTRKPI